MDVSPLPNCKSNVLSEFTLVENLYGTFCTSKMYGVVPTESLISLSATIFADSMNTLSCARYGTSYHLVLPPSDVHDVICIILVSLIVFDGYSSYPAKSNWISFSVAEMAFTFLVIRYCVGCPVLVSLLNTSISLLPEFAKSTLSTVLNITDELVDDTISIPSCILKKKVSSGRFELPLSIDGTNW